MRLLIKLDKTRKGVLIMSKSIKEKAVQVIAQLRGVPAEHINIDHGFIRVYGIDHGVVEFNKNSITLHQFDAKECTFLLA